MQALAQGKTQYRIHWKGYESTADTWEPVENLTGCDRLLAKWNLTKAYKLKADTSAEVMRKSKSTEVLRKKRRKGKQSSRPLRSIEPDSDIEPEVGGGTSNTQKGTTESTDGTQKLAAVATTKCNELSHLLWFIRMDWKLPSAGNKLKQMEVYRKYQSERYNLREINGCIYKANDTNSKDVLQGGKYAGQRHLLWVVPGDLRWGIMRAAHDGPDAGHPSYRTTLLKVRETMWWPRMASDIKAYADACDAYQRAKRGTRS